MIAVEAPRSLDDLVLSAEGEEARQAAADAIVDGIPVDLDPLPLVEPEEEQEPTPEDLRRRASHERAMLRAFPARTPQMRGLRRARKESGKWAPKYPDWLADFWTRGEVEADLRAFPLPYAPDPEIVDGEIVWGASVTIEPAVQLDPECAWEWRDVPPPVPSGEVVDAVSAWLETLYEPLTIRDLADVTGYSYAQVHNALSALHAAGLVARQETAAIGRGRPPVVWLWRRLPR